jgi:hypothetical protein
MINNFRMHVDQLLLLDIFLNLNFSNLLSKPSVKHPLLFQIMVILTIMAYCRYFILICRLPLLIDFCFFLKLFFLFLKIPYFDLSFCALIVVIHLVQFLDYFRFLERDLICLFSDLCKFGVNTFFEEICWCL